jgi:hypothetical protein
MPRHSLAEVFGFPADTVCVEALRHSTYRLCPFNSVPNCTWENIVHPGGVCSIFSGDDAVITCPIRFREDWLIVVDAAEFLFPPGTKWTSLTNVPLHVRDAPVGYVDFVLVAFDKLGGVADFGALVVQAPDKSDSAQPPFDYPNYSDSSPPVDWTTALDATPPDHTSLLKRGVVHQLIHKGAILHAWKKKMAVAVDTNIFRALPPLPPVDPIEADIALLIYDLKLHESEGRYRLNRHRMVYTSFTALTNQRAAADPSEIDAFVSSLQSSIEEQADGERFD